jgi:hypothetical protein
MDSAVQAYASVHGCAAHARHACAGTLFGMLTEEEGARAKSSLPMAQYFCFLATSAPGVGLSIPCHIRTGTGPTPATSCPGTGLSQVFLLWPHVARHRTLAADARRRRYGQHVRCCAVRCAVECRCSQWRGGGPICHSGMSQGASVCHMRRMTSSST